eukprot:4974270-Amphidinium_carterae.1
MSTCAVGNLRLVPFLLLLLHRVIGATSQSTMLGCLFSNAHASCLLLGVVRALLVMIRLGEGSQGFRKLFEHKGGGVRDVTSTVENLVRGCEQLWNAFVPVLARLLDDGE